MRFHEIAIGAGISRVGNAMVVDTIELIGISVLIPHALLRAPNTADDTIDLKRSNSTKPTTYKSGSPFKALLY